MLSAFHALSGDPALEQARQLLIEQSSNATLEEAIKECLNRNNSREVLKRIASNLLDAVAHQKQHQMHDDLVAVEEVERQRIPEEYAVVKEEEGAENEHSWSRVHVKEERDDVHANITTRVTEEVDGGSKETNYFAMGAHDRGPGSRKHRISETPHAPEKRARISRPTTIPEDSAQVKHESPGSVEERATNSASVDREGVARPEAPHTILMQAIPKIIVILGYPQHGKYRPIDYASHQIGNHLLRQLKLDYNFDADDRAAYNCILQFGQAPQCYTRCLNTLVNGRDNCTWTASNGRERYSCDFCIETGRVCARLPRGAVNKIAISSILVQLRMRIKATELEFWPQEPQKAEISSRRK